MRRMLSLLMAVLFVVSIPVTALAAEYDIANGSITINANESGQTVTQTGNADVQNKPDAAPVITGTSNTNNVTVNADEGSTANVTLKDVTIDTSDDNYKPAVNITGGGDTVIELEGSNNLTSGHASAGLQTSQSGGSLTITDTDGDGSLTATGGDHGAGIGGGERGDGNNITIEGGNITANGGMHGAGIGGGYVGDGTNIKISGGVVNANGGAEGGAGIGGGYIGNGTNIEISGGVVNATGGGDYNYGGGAGIGGGNNDGNPYGGGNGSNITISGGEVNAVGGNGSAGIGGGFFGSGESVTISGNADVTAIGSSFYVTDYEDSDGDGNVEELVSWGGGAGIGGGIMGAGQSITIKENANVTAIGADNAANAGDGDSGNESKNEDNLELELDSNGGYNEPAPAPEPEVVALPCVSTDENGNALEWTKAMDEDSCVITVAGEGKSVAFSFYRWFLNSLKRQGAEKLVVKTAVGEIELSIQELLDMSGNKYVLTFDGGKVALTVDGEAKEI